MSHIGEKLYQWKNCEHFLTYLQTRKTHEVQNNFHVAILLYIWGHTLGKDHINAAKVIILSYRKVILQHTWGYILGRKQEIQSIWEDFTQNSFILLYVTTAIWFTLISQIWNVILGHLLDTVLLAYVSKFWKNIVRWDIWCIFYNIFLWPTVYI